MGISLAGRITEMVKEGLAAYKTYLGTRQEAYNRQRDRRHLRAIENAEKYIHTNDILIAKLKAEYPGKFKRNIKSLQRYRYRFFKYN